MQEQIFKDLEKLGHKFSTVEETIGCPKNYLSRFKNPENILPKKWIEPLQGYIKKHLIAPVKIDMTITPVPATKLVVTKSGLQEKPSAERIQKLRELTEKMNKDFGAGTVMELGDKPIENIEVVSTGSMGLDKALGIGGLPKGRIVEIFGPESSGKTTIALHIIAEAQKQGLTCLLIDAENSFDPEYASNIGVKVNELLTCQPSYGEQGLEVADRYISSGQVGVVVIDSVAALVPKGELEGEMGDSKMGLHARLMSQACRKMVGSISKNNVVCIFINQLRNKIGIIYGSPEVTTGGMALQFYASVRLDVRKKVTLKDGEVSVGNLVKVKVIKNKCSPPFKSAEFEITFGEGINRIGEIVDMAVEKNVIVKAGSWYSYEGNKLGQGRDMVCGLLRDNEEMANEILSKL